MTPASQETELRKLIGMPARDFVRHRARMLLLDTLTDIGAEFTSCSLATSDTLFFEADAGIPGYIGIEYMAQCIAVHAGAREKIKGLDPPLGFLLGTRHFRCSVKYFEPNGAYFACCREIVRDSQGMASFSCELLQDGTSIASANISVFEKPPDWTIDQLE